jgi:hypothetical protein
MILTTRHLICVNILRNIFMKINIFYDTYNTPSYSCEHFTKYFQENYFFMIRYANLFAWTFYEKFSRKVIFMTLMIRHLIRVNILRKIFTKINIFYDTIRHLICVNILRNIFTKINIFMIWYAILFAWIFYEKFSRKLIFLWYDTPSYLREHFTKYFQEN